MSALDTYPVFTFRSLSVAGHVPVTLQGRGRGRHDVHGRPWLRNLLENDQLLRTGNREQFDHVTWSDLTTANR